MQLTLGNALAHFRRTNGPRGFLWKFIVFYLLVMGALQIVSMAVNWPIYELYAEFFAGGAGGGELDPQELNERMRPYQLRNMLWTLISLPLSMLIWVVLEGAVQRRYMRAEGFRLRVGADEKRLAVIGLIWAGFAFALYLALIVVTIMVALLAALLASIDPVLGIMVGVIATLAFIGVLLYFTTRFSAASALTVRDQQIKFFQSWTVTRGRWRGMFNAFIILSVISLILIVIMYAIGFVIGYSQIEPLLRGNSPDSAAVLAKLASPSVYVPLAILYGVYLLFAPVFWYIWSGVGALAAKTDPNWVGQIGIAGEFD